MQFVLEFSSYGIGSHSHFGTEALALTAGVVLNHIPYKAPSETVPALIDGQIHFSLLAMATAVQLVKQGRIKALAAIGSARSPILPDAPTLAEAGFGASGVKNAWFGLSVRASTPKATVEKIAADVGRVLNAADFREKYFIPVGLVASGLAGGSLIAEIREERASYAVATKRLNLKPE